MNNINSDFDDIDLESFNVIEYLEDVDISYTEGGTKNTTEGWVNIQCPSDFCDDQSNHCGINLESKNFSCWKCGESGTIIKLIKWIENCNYFEAIEIVKEYLDPSAVYKHNQTKNATKLILPTGISDKFPPSYIKYLKEDRGFDPYPLINKYKLLAAGPIGDYKFRIIIPFFLDGQFVTFTGRAISDKAKLKYKNFAKSKSIIDVKRILYNLDNISGPNAALFEGVTDVWRIGNNTVATCGMKTTKEQIYLLKDYGVKNLFVIFDGESEAIQRANKVANLASHIIERVEVIELAEDYDPCTLPDDDVKQIQRMLK